MSLVRFVFATLASGLVALTACSDSTPPPAKVLLTSTMGPGANGQAVCQLSSAQWVNISAAGASVNNGDTDSTGARVSVNCSVTSNADGSFQVNAIATLQGTQGGSITITGKMGPRGPQTPVRGVFQRGDTGSFAQDDCTVSYDDPGMGIAVGRVWANISCPQVKKPDSNPPRVCSGNATFKFENCATQ